MSVHPWNQPLWHDLTRDRAKLPHALLLHGPKGVGKRDFALALAKWLFCEAPVEDGACDHCKACSWFEQNAHPDFRLVEPASDSDRAEEGGKKVSKIIGIGEIRELGDFMGLVSHQGGWRVVVIQPAESMNPAAGNALLKTLEEPPAGVLLVLVAHQPRQLLPTVRSRCRKLAFSLPARDLAREWLAVNNQVQAVSALDEVGGAPLLAMEYAEPDRLERRRRFLAGLANPEASSLSQLGQEFQQRLEESWGWLSRWLYDVLAIQASGVPRYFPEQTAVLGKLARRAQPVVLWQFQQELLAAGRWLKHPLNGQLLLESWLLHYLDTMEVRHGR
jgi:DNA polymerase-3 subunit delta'